MSPPARVHGEGPRRVPRPLSQPLAVPGLSEAQLLLLSVGGSHLVPVVLDGDPDVEVEQFQPLEKLDEPELGPQPYQATERRVLFQQRQSQAAVDVGDKSWVPHVGGADRLILDIVPSILYQPPLHGLADLMSTRQEMLLQNLPQAAQLPHAIEGSHPPQQDVLPLGLELAQLVADVLEGRRGDDFLRHWWSVCVMIQFNLLIIKCAYLSIINLTDTLIFPQFLIAVAAVEIV